MNLLGWLASQLNLLVNYASIPCLHLNLEQPLCALATHPRQNALVSEDHKKTGKENCFLVGLLLAALVGWMNFVRKSIRIRRRLMERPQNFTANPQTHKKNLLVVPTSLHFSHEGTH